MPGIEMLKQNKYLLYITILFLLQFIPVNAQDVDIVPYLKKIESGNGEEVKTALVDLKEDHPNSPAVKFLEGVLTENGQEAIVIYQDIVDNFSESKYADAALYRIYSYYYALGLYETADEKLKLLISEYPNSPYVKIAQENIAEGNKTEEKKSENENNVEMKPPDEKHVTAEDKFTIQSGAFTSLENAESLFKDLQGSGIFSRIVEKSVGGTTFHIVYAGKFTTYGDAENFLQVINTKFNITGRVVPIPW